MFNNFFKLLFVSAIFFEAQASLPLTEGAWTVLSYNKIPANTVAFADNSLTVKVSSSAGPIVHKLEKPAKIFGFKIQGKVTGQKKLETTAFDEDSILRLGFVAVGNQKLTGTKKWFAADWVKKLFSLAPEGTGLDKIYFFNLTNRPDLIGKTRTHPQSELIVETVFAEQTSQGKFEFSKDFESPIETAAIWMSIDGDNTKSQFETNLSLVQLKLAN